ncbi:MAG TPA: hypothetical protein VGB59_12970 [Allosphingosinicella sp.]|jgi:hypothetical protein
MIRRAITMPAAAALMLAAQPCLAAELVSVQAPGAAPTMSRTAAFAGGTIRLPLGRGGAGGAKAMKPQARLQIGFAHNRTGGSFGVREMSVSGLSLGEGRKGKAALFLGGTGLRDFRKKVGMSTGGAIAVGVGVTLVALLALAAASGTPDIGCSVGDEGCD